MDGMGWDPTGISAQQLVSKGKPPFLTASLDPVQNSRDGVCKGTA